MSDATTRLDAELAALWVELPLGERSAAGTLRALAESTGIDEAVLERHWREALLTEVAQLAANETGRLLAAAALERTPAAEAVTASVRILATVATRYRSCSTKTHRPPHRKRRRSLLRPNRTSSFERWEREGIRIEAQPLLQLVK